METYCQSSAWCSLPCQGANLAKVTGWANMLLILGHYKSSVTAIDSLTQCYFSAIIFETAPRGNNRTIAKALNQTQLYIISQIWSFQIYLSAEYQSGNPLRCMSVINMKQLWYQLQRNSTFSSLKSSILTLNCKVIDSTKTQIVDLVLHSKYSTG